jgi:hypothetical protein
MFGDGQPRPPNMTRTNHVTQTLNPAPFGGQFGGHDWRYSSVVAGTFRTLCENCITLIFLSCLLW